MIEKSQSVIDNRKHLMELVGYVVEDNKLVLKTSNPNIFIVLDTETTGLSELKDRVVQFSAIKYKVENGKLIEIDRLDTYINQSEYDENKIIPGRNGDPDITFKDLTGITNEMLSSAPSEEEALEIISNFLGEDPIFICYNTPFDYKFLCQMYIRHGKELVVDPNKKLDVLVMAKDLVKREEAPVLLNAKGEPVLDKSGKEKKTWKLSYIAGLYGLDKAEDAEETDETIAFHSSINDVVVTGRLLNTFISEYKTEIEEELYKPPVEKHRAKVLSLGFYEGYRGFSRVYVNAMLNGEYIAYYYDIRKKIWGEKESGLIEQTMMPEMKADALELAGVTDEESFGKAVKEAVSDPTLVRKEIKADDAFLERYK